MWRKGLEISVIHNAATISDPHYKERMVWLYLVKYVKAQEEFCIELVEMKKLLSFLEININ